MSYTNKPSNEDINEMRRLRAILNGESTSHLQNTTNIKNDRSSSSGNPDVIAMENILRKLNSVSDVVAGQLVEDAKTSPRITEALETKATANGMLIGKWEIRTTLAESMSSKRKVYDIIDTNTNSHIFEGLVLLEAAHAIIRYFNKGLNPNNPKVTAILELEETYNRNRIDAVRFKQRYQRCVELKEKQAGHIFADRFQVARANAMVAQDQIKSILESIR